MYTYGPTLSLHGALTVLGGPHRERRPAAWRERRPRRRAGLRPRAARWVQGAAAPAPHRRAAPERLRKGPEARSASRARLIDPRAFRRAPTLGAAPAASVPRTHLRGILDALIHPTHRHRRARSARRSEEHTSELPSLMRTSYAVFCLKQKTT